MDQSKNVKKESVDLKSLKKAFDLYDKDKSGSLTFDEISTLCKESFGYNIPSNEISKIFKEIDSNKDDKISFDEFTAWWRVGRGSNSNASMVKNYITIVSGIKIVDEEMEKFEKKIDANEKENIINMTGISFKIDKEKDSKLQFGATQINFEIRPSQTVGEILKKAFPDLKFKEQFQFVYLTLSCKDAPKLAKGIKDFYDQIEILYEMVYQKDKADKKPWDDEEAINYLQQLKIKIGHHENNCYILLDPSKLQPLTDFLTKVKDTKRLFKMLQPSLNVSIKSCVSLKDMIANCDKVGKLTTISAPNLLDFILKGCSLTATCSVDKKLKTSLYSAIAVLLDDSPKNQGSASAFVGTVISLEGKKKEIANDMDANTLTETIIEILFPEEEKKQVTKVLTVTNPKEKFVKALGEKFNSTHVLDIYDVLDLIGSEYCKLHSEHISKYPFVLEFIEDLEQFGLCNFTFGAVNEVFNLSLNFKTEGVKEVWNFFKSRMSANND